MDDTEGMQVDPGSISLFSAPTTDANPPSTFGTFDEGTLHMDFVDVDGQQPSRPGQAGTSTEKSYSKYMQKKAADAANRRHFIERMERLKNTRGLSFTIPQFKQATMYQLSLFLRRLRKHGEAKSLISGDMIDRLFVNKEAQRVPQPGPTRYIIDGRTSSGPIPSSEANRQTTSFTQAPSFASEEATDEESTDYEDDELLGSKKELSVELYDLLAQKSRICSADAQANRIQNEIEANRAWAESMLIDFEEDEFIFDAPEETGDQDADSMTCARCRPLLAQPKSPRKLIAHDFKREAEAEDRIRPIISKKRCDVHEYSFTDDSIHPELSLPTAIPFDSQLQKYIHLISFIPRDVENRRYKTAKLISEATGKNLTQKFYNLEEDNPREGQDEQFGSTEGTKGIRISLGPLRKTAQKEAKSGADDSDYESNPPDEDREFTLASALSKKRRRMTIDQPAPRRGRPPKASKMESRRCSQVEFGSSMFDYDSQLMDIGLPLPAIQKVENVEIAIPSFRRKPSMLELPSTVDCHGCHSQKNDQWSDIRRLHGDLESQERYQRFRPQTGSTARKMTAASETSGKSH